MTLGRFPHPPHQASSSVGRRVVRWGRVVRTSCCRRTSCSLGGELFGRVVADGRVVARVVADGRVVARVVRTSCSRASCSRETSCSSEFLSPGGVLQSSFATQGATLAKHSAHPELVVRASDPPGSLLTVLSSAYVPRNRLPHPPWLNHDCRRALLRSPPGRLCCARGLLQCASSRQTRAPPSLAAYGHTTSTFGRRRP